MVTLPLTYLFTSQNLSRPLFPISLGGEGVGVGELNKMIGAYGQCENGESNKNNFQISTELKNLISETQFFFSLEYAGICCLTSICRFPREKMKDGWGSEVKWGDIAQNGYCSRDIILTVELEA